MKTLVIYFLLSVLCILAAGCQSSGAAKDREVLDINKLPQTITYTGTK